MTTTTSAAALTLVQQIELLSGADFWRTREIADAGIPGMLLADGPHGLRVQRGGSDHLGLNDSMPATCFPPAVTLASSWDTALIKEVGAAVGREATALGVGVVLGPGLNIKRHPLCGRNFEYYSEDPLLSGRLAAAAVLGLQSTGVGACVKHFAVNNQEHRRFVIDAIVDERTRREIYLRGFELAIREARPVMVMAAYNRVNGVHCTDDAELLNGVLRNEWGFDGVVVSDWGAEVDRVQGVAAGMDLEMPAGVGRIRELTDAINAGDLDPTAVATSAQRISDLARSLPAQEGTIENLQTQHDALARRAAAESAIVLTNDGILPLKGTERIAVIGAFADTPRYQGSGSSLVSPTQITTMLDAFAAAGVDVAYSAGYEPERSERDVRLIAGAVEVAKSADVVIVMIGLPGIKESEGFDRDNLNLPQQHDDLVAAISAVNSRTVVVLSNGSPVLMPWHGDVAAILECYLGGQASGGAAVDALLGVTEPAGRLAETFPAAQEDVAADPYFPGNARQVQYREGLFVGYRHATTAGIRPLFAFGHGLGYGRTTWRSAAVSRRRGTDTNSMTATVVVENTGDRPTSEVVQIYARDLTGVVLRPHRELAGFAKVHLAVGERQNVHVDIDPRSFSFWDSRVDEWRTPAGRFELEIARSSERIELTIPITVVGDAYDSSEPPTVGAIAKTDSEFESRLGHPIPVPAPERPFTRDSTIGDLSVTMFGRLFRTLMRRAANLPESTLNDPVTMAMIERSTDELPLRGLVQLSGGRSTWAFVDAVILFANRRPGRAFLKLLGGRSKR